MGFLWFWFWLVTNNAKEAKSFGKVGPILKAFIINIRLSRNSWPEMAVLFLGPQGALELLYDLRWTQDSFHFPLGWSNCYLRDILLLPNHIFLGTARITLPLLLATFFTICCNKCCFALDRIELIDNFGTLTKSFRYLNTSLFHKPFNADD